MTLIIAGFASEANFFKKKCYSRRDYKYAPSVYYARGCIYDQIIWLGSYLSRPDLKEWEEFVAMQWSVNPNLEVISTGMY